MTDVFSVDADGRFRTLMRALPWVLALICAAMVTFDAAISRAIPSQIWRILHIENFPLKSSLTLPPLMIALWWARRFTRAIPLKHIAIAAIFVASQAGGLKIGPIDPLDVVTLLIVMAAVANRLNNPTAGLKITSLLFFATALIGLNVLTLIHQPPLQHIVGAIGLLKVVLLAAVLLHLIDDQKSILFAGRAVVTVALLSASAALMQALLYFQFGIDITFIDHFGGTETHFKPTPFGMLPRTSAFNSTAQHLSSFLLIALPFALLSRNEIERPLRKLLTVAVLLSGLVSTWNFGAMFAALFILLCYPYLRWPRYAIHIAMAMVLLVIGSYYSGLLDWLYAHSFGDAGVAKGVSQRHTLMYLGLDSLSRFPLFGEGLRGFADISANYWHRPVHNAYLQAATEIGLIGGLVFAVMLITKLTQLAILAHVATQDSGHIRAAFLALLGLCLLFFSEPMLDHSNTWILLGLSEALIIWHAARHKQSYSDLSTDHAQAPH